MLIMFNIIKAENLSKTYNLQRQKTFKEFLPALFLGQETKNSFAALSHLNFEINKGESLGILGRNGSGKSTLLKIIAGVTKPSDGRITVHGKVAPLIELGAGFHPELTGRDNVYFNGSILGSGPLRVAPSDKYKILYFFIFITKINLCYLISNTGTNAKDARRLLSLSIPSYWI